MKRPRWKCSQATDWPVVRNSKVNWVHFNWCAKECICIYILYDYIYEYIYTELLFQIGFNGTAGFRWSIGTNQYAHFLKKPSPVFQKNRKDPFFASHFFNTEHFGAFGNILHQLLQFLPICVSSFLPHGGTDLNRFDSIPKQTVSISKTSRKSVPNKKLGLSLSICHVRPISA